MSDSFKLRFLKLFTAALKEITPANGYETDLADFDPGDGAPMPRVYRGRAWFGENDPIPMLSILENPNPAEELLEIPQAAKGEFDWHLIVQGFVMDDPQNPTDPAYTLLADTRQRIAIEATRKRVNTKGMPDPFGCGTGKNRVTAVFIGSGVVRPADDVSAKAYFWLPVTVRVVESATEPYA